jgi:hypothetical protein
MQGFFAQFILSGQSEILRCAQDDSEGLRMTAPTSFSAACSAAGAAGNATLKVRHHIGGTKYSQITIARGVGAA